MLPAQLWSRGSEPPLAVPCPVCSAGPGLSPGLRPAPFTTCPLHAACLGEGRNSAFMALVPTCHPKAEPLSSQRLAEDGDFLSCGASFTSSLLSLPMSLGWVPISQTSSLPLVLNPAFTLPPDWAPMQIRPRCSFASKTDSQPLVTVRRPVRPGSRPSGLIWLALPFDATGPAGSVTPSPLQDPAWPPRAAFLPRYSPGEVTPDPEVPFEPGHAPAAAEFTPNPNCTSRLSCLFL